MNVEIRGLSVGLGLAVLDETHRSQPRAWPVAVHSCRILDAVQRGLLGLGLDTHRVIVLAWWERLHGGGHRAEMGQADNHVVGVVLASWEHLRGGRHGLGLRLDIVLVVARWIRLHGGHGLGLGLDIQIVGIVLA